MTKNRHGLERRIPEQVKREVRQRVGFGCIYDGNVLVEYEHFDPEFVECVVHDPNGITLLCAGCHDKKTRGRLAKEMVEERNRTPYCLTASSAWTDLGWSQQPLEVSIGSNVFLGVGSLLCVYGVDVLKVEPPETSGAPFRLSARFFDENRTEAVRITENHLEAQISSWDVSEVKNRITVRQAPRHVSLQIVHDPPRRFVVERLDMRYGDHRITIDSGGQVVVQMTDSPFGPHVVGTVAGNRVDGSGTGILIPVEGGFRIGKPRPTDGPPWGEDAYASWRDL